MIWDDHQGRCIGELGFRSQVRVLLSYPNTAITAIPHRDIVVHLVYKCPGTGGEITER